MKKEQVITRFPPSPTGYLHIGRARTALFNYLFSRHNDGKMILRIEDTDKERSKKEYEESILECLEWLHIKYDEGPFRQSERNEVYKKYIKQLIDSGSAYISKEVPKEEGGRAEVIRFKNPNKKITFTDIIRGEVAMDTTDLGDFVIARTMEEPIYHLTAVVDDHEMGITHVIRGEDHISNTPRQILIQEALGAARPLYAHIPLILAPDKSKLSGRHGAVSVTEYKDKGYLPEALVNYLALLGWNPGTEQELFSLDELIKVFDLSKVQKGGAIFNIEKLNWFNKNYIEKLDSATFAKHAEPFLPKDLSKDFLDKLLPLLKEKISFFGEIPELFKGELSFIYPLPAYEKSKLNWKQEKESSVTKSHIKTLMGILNELQDKNFTKEIIKEKIWPYAEEKGRGNVLWPMRFALSGKDRSPDPFILAEILGKKETLQRLNAAYEII
jgi:glutamyl-tRNA synthetase